MEKPSRRVCSRRGVIAAIAVVPLTAALPKPVKADLFGDIGVLLAQLEQQLQLVSNAVATVQNLVRTVESLGKVVKASEMLLKQAGNGGLSGILNAAAGFVGLARGVTSNLRSINSSASWWKNNIERMTSTDSPGTNTRSYLEARKALAENDALIIATAADTSAGYTRIEDSYKALNASGEAVQEALRTEGVVGQMQLAGRQNYHLSTIALHQDEMTTDLAMRNQQELVRMAAERARNRKLVEGAMAGLADVKESAPVSRPNANAGSEGVTEE